MNSSFINKIFLFCLVIFVLISCTEKNHQPMTASDNNQIINEVKKAYDSITHYSEKADLDSFLHCYSNSEDFIAISGDGKMRNYHEYKNSCAEYYNSLKEQKLSTTQKVVHVIDSNIVIVSWVGNINAFFKNGDIMKMKDYAITSVFKKIDDKWKVIHSHESSLPPEIIKAK